jgi:glutathione reductase (NADPH)
MWSAANHAETLHDLKEYGFNVKYEGFNMKALKEARDKYIQRLNGIYKSNLEKDKVFELVSCDVLYLSYRLDTLYLLMLIQWK